MSRIQKLLAMVALACGLSVPTAGSAASSSAQSVDEAWKQAIEAGDLEGVVSCYAENATLWLPGAAEAKGRDAIREVYRGILDANTVSEVRFTHTSYRSAGALQAGSGDFSLVLTPKSGGASSSLAGRFSTLVEKENGRWVYSLDHASSGPAQ